LRKNGTTLDAYRLRTRGLVAALRNHHARMMRLAPPSYYVAGHRRLVRSVRSALATGERLLPILARGARAAGPQTLALASAFDRRLKDIDTAQSAIRRSLGDATRGLDEPLA